MRRELGALLVVGAWGVRGKSSRTNQTSKCVRGCSAFPFCSGGCVMSEVQSSADKLRIGSAACRISFTWFGVRKTLSSDQKAEAAEAFGASGEFLSAGKRLVDTKNPAWKAVSSVRSRARAYWVGATLPFPEAGIRLLRRSDIEPF